MRNVLVTLTTSLALVSGCSRQVPARGEGSSTAVARASDTGVSAAPSSPGSIRGDTFVLVAIGSQSTRVPTSDSAPCGFQPYLRVVIWDEQWFYRITDADSLTCFGPPTDSATRAVGVWRSTYRLNGDTLNLFQGDGNETFQWVSGILSNDSLIGLGQQTLPIRAHSANGGAAASLGA